MFTDEPLQDTMSNQSQGLNNTQTGNRLYPGFTYAKK